VHRLVAAVIRHRLPSDWQQTTAEQVVALRATAYPGDPDDPARWAAYAELSPHVLATAPLGDSSPASRHMVLEAVGFLQAHGDASNVCQRCPTVQDQIAGILV
jgi:hypothetical protein